MQPPPEDKSVANFAALREQCLALRDLLLPDELWPQFEKWHQTADNVAWHRSMILLAFQRDHLAKLTSPIHRYLYTQGSVRPDVRQQYRKDLSERWMYYDDPLDRPYKLERKGELIELQPEEVERQASLDEKLGLIVPELLGLPSPKGRAEWGSYVQLRRLRDATVHIKSHHQWTRADRDFEASPYSRFIEESAAAIPIPAVRLLEYFVVEHEREWLKGATDILKA